MASAKKTSFWLLFILLGAALALWGVYWVFVTRVISSEQSRGQFGDMFGGVNALFTAFAFAGATFTLLLQRDQLREQGAQLEAASRREEKAQKTRVRQAQALALASAIDAVKYRIDRY